MQIKDENYRWRLSKLNNMTANMSKDNVTNYPSSYGEHKNKVLVWVKIKIIHYPSRCV